MRCTLQKVGQCTVLSTLQKVGQCTVLIRDETELLLQWEVEQGGQWPNIWSSLFERYTLSGQVKLFLGTENSWWCESLMSYDELNFSCSCSTLLEVVGKDLGRTLRCIKMNFPAISVKTSVLFYQNHNGNNSLGSTAVIVEESRLILSNPIQKSGYHRKEEGGQCSKVRKLVNVFLNCWCPSQLLQLRPTSMEIQLTSLPIRLLSLCQNRLLLWAL